MHPHFLFQNNGLIRVDKRPDKPDGLGCGPKFVKSELCLTIRRRTMYSRKESTARAEREEQRVWVFNISKNESACVPQGWSFSTTVTSYMITKDE